MTHVSDEELQESIKLARHRLGPWSLSEEEYEIPKDLCRALLVLHAENRRYRAAQLTADDRQSLEFVHDAVLGHLARVGDEAACMHALDVLERLIAAEKP